MSRLVNLVLDAANPRLETHNSLSIHCFHGEKLATAKAIIMASSASTRQVLKRNFSASETAVLTEKVEENLSVIESKLTNSVTRR